MRGTGGIDVHVVIRKGILSVIHLLLIVYALSIIFPFIWLAVNSLKTNQEFYFDIWKIPDQLHWSNYADALHKNQLGKYFFNSIYVTVAGTAAALIFSAMAAYTVAKFSFRGRSIIFFFAVSTYLIPTAASIAALYRLMVDFQVINTHIGLIILYSSGLGFNFIILYGFFKGISWEYAEAAYLDGAGDWSIFFRIMLPLAKPGLAAVGLVTLINIWNDYFLPYLFLRDQKLYTVSVGLQNMVLRQQYAADWTTLFAALILATLPVLITYLFMQKQLISGFTTGGLKG